MVFADQLISIHVHVVISCCVGHWCFFLINSTEILNDFTKHIKSERYGITVRRAHVLKDALKSAKRMCLDPTMSIDVNLLDVH